MKTLLRCLVLLGAGALISPDMASSCSCAWLGGFLDVGPQCPVFVRGAVQHYHGESRRMKLEMDVDVREVLKGSVAEKTLRIRGDNGMLCRAAVEQFALGREYIFALDRHDLATIYGEVKAGRRYTYRFGRRFQFVLEPQPLGWLITVVEEGRTEDLSRLTPPFHFVPNPRELEGWHLRNSDNTGPNDPGEKNLNAPGRERDFVFSPEVGKTIDGPQSKAKPTSEEVERIARFGQGKLTILDYRLEDLEPGKQARFVWIKFKLELSWAARRENETASLPTKIKPWTGLVGER